MKKQEKKIVELCIKKDGAIDVRLFTFAKDIIFEFPKVYEDKEVVKFYVLPDDFFIEFFNYSENAESREVTLLYKVIYVREKDCQEVMKIGFNMNGDVVTDYMKKDMMKLLTQLQCVGVINGKELSKIFDKSDTRNKQKNEQEEGYIR